jgi:hypothetical protein
MQEANGQKLKPKKEQLNKIKEVLKQNYDLNLSDKEALDCYISLFYLGRAIFRFNQQKGVVL